jgi:hypothetical protein
MSNLNRTKGLLLTVFFLTITFSDVFSQKNENLTAEYSVSLQLVEQSWQLLDNYVDSIWPEWNDYKEKSVFIGAPAHYDLFINPYKDVPLGFEKVNSILNDKLVFYRDSSHLDRATNTTFVRFDSQYYNLVRVVPYAPDFYKKYVDYSQKIYYNDSIVPKEFENFTYSKENWIKIFIHESFHIYQLKSKDISSLQIPVSYKSPKQAALSFIEGQLLLKALDADNNEELKTYLHQFLAVRNKRRSNLPFWSKNYEEISEWLEGCATYVEYNVNILLTKDSPTNHFAENNNQFNFLELYKNFLDKHSRHFAEEGKEYYYGWAMSLLLDKLCGNNWKSELLKDNVYLTDLIQKYSCYDKKKNNYYYKKAEINYQYSELKKEVMNSKRNGKYYIQKTTK